MNTTYTTADAFNELFQSWNKIMGAAKKEFPQASAEELYQIVKGAMCQSLGMKF